MSPVTPLDLGPERLLREPEGHTFLGHNDLALQLWRHSPASQSAPKVLFVHGYLDTGRSFDRLIARAQGQIEALCLDLRGHGASSWVGAGGAYHALDYVKDVCQVLLKLQKMGERMDAVVAHSMGGNVMMLLEGSWPGLAGRLLLLDAFGAPSEPAEDQPARLGEALRAMQQVKPFKKLGSLREMAARVLETNPGLSPEGAAWMVQHAWLEVAGEPGRVTFAFDPRLRGPTPQRWTEETWVALCERMACPVRLLRAEFGYVPSDDPRLAARLAACRDAKMTTLSGAYHNLHVDRVEEVLAALQDLLTLPRGDAPTP